MIKGLAMYHGKTAMMAADSDDMRIMVHRRPTWLRKRRDLVGQLLVAVGVPHSEETPNPVWYIEVDDRLIPFSSDLGLQLTKKRRYSIESAEVDKMRKKLVDWEVIKEGGVSTKLGNIACAHWIPQNRDMSHAIARRLGLPIPEPEPTPAPQVYEPRGVVDVNE